VKCPAIEAGLFSFWFTLWQNGVEHSGVHVPRRSYPS
jgi:hypothetical protein